MQFIVNHWGEIVQSWGYITLASTIIVKMTPSTKDDAVLAKVIGFFNLFSVVNPKPKA